MRSPVKYGILMAFIGAAFALAGEWLLSKKGEQEQRQQYNQQEKHLQILSDSIKNLQTEFLDSIANLRHDTSR